MKVKEIDRIPRRNYRDLPLLERLLSPPLPPLIQRRNTPRKTSGNEEGRADASIPFLSFFLFLNDNESNASPCRSKKAFLHDRKPNGDFPSLHLGQSVNNLSSGIILSHVHRRISSGPSPDPDLST